MFLAGIDVNSLHFFLENSGVIFNQFLLWTRAQISFLTKPKIAIYGQKKYVLLCFDLATPLL